MRFLYEFCWRDFHSQPDAPYVVHLPFGANRWLPFFNLITYTREPYAYKFDVTVEPSQFRGFI